ncbi:ATP-dependent nuclease [Rhizobium ruizarguesonis]|uniref:ATP-dependent nuclease n=1 Tax=Rhizobium ruizarguesonis TaxID=2081791 RepID=UPI0010326CEF|nr:AAA family ATPase [Rhizobium ruizarguesonis]TBA06367.1 hypothetical protein ELH64_18860 [Rhizobium ruizarguesonis]
MHIESLSIRNFRCFGDEAIQINLAAGTNAFVGNNGAGKTAALEALKRLFSPIASDRQIRRSDVHFGPGEDIHRIGGSEREIVIEAVFGFPGHTTNAQVFTDLFFNGSDKSLKVRVRLECKYGNANPVDDDLEVKFYAVRTLDPVPFGPDDERKIPLRGRPTQYAELVYIPAHRDSRGISQTALRNLLQRLERSADWDENTRSKSKGFAEDLQKNLNETPALKLVTQTLDGFWASLHDGHYDGKIELGVVATEFQKLIRDLTLRFVKAPGGGQRQLDELSEGQTSLLYFALSATLHKLVSDMQKAAPKKLDGFISPDFIRPTLTLFALEEPENHLAPFYLPKLISLLDTLNVDGSAQAVVTSHATSILSRIPPRHVRYFRMDPTSLRSRVLELPLPEKESEEDKFVQQVILANPEVYFARLVIVGEGDTERLVIPRVSDALGVSLDPSFIAYVSIGGRHAQHLWRLLNGLNIPHVTLLDFDLGRTGGGIGRLKNAVSWLTDLGPSYVPTWLDKDQNEVPATAEAVAGIAPLTHETYLTWVQWLRRRNIFYSAPVDLDMMMLQAFPEAYQAETPYNPNAAPGEVARLETSVFKKGAGRTEIQAVGLVITNEQLHAYDELFKSSSKPGSHLLAFTKLTPAKINAGCPEPLRALVTRAKEMLAAKANSGSGL